MSVRGDVQRGKCPFPKSRELAYLFAADSLGFYSCLYNWLQKTRYSVKWSDSGALGCWRSFKVIEIETNRQPVCDFPLETNSSLGYTAHRFRVIAMKTSEIVDVTMQPTLI